jgi:hypothetical protein
MDPDLGTSGCSAVALSHVTAVHVAKQSRRPQYCSETFVIGHLRKRGSEIRLAVF